MHVASIVDAFGTSDHIMQEVNVGGTQVLLECAANSKSVKRFVYTSSSGVLEGFRCLSPLPSPPLPEH